MAESADDRDDSRDRKTKPDSGGFHDRLTRLGERLGAAKGRHPDPEDAQRRGNAMGVAFRIATELIAGVLVGGGIGWLLDEWLGTSPFLLLIFFVLGAAAGILNVMRTAYEMQQGASGAGKEPKRSGHRPGSE